MAAMGGGTSGILQAGTTEEKGSNARLSAFVGAMAIADLVKSTLGPKGMDKILQSVGRGRGVTVTNDGATILRSIYVDNPAAKVLVDISRVQDEEVGDGTTSVVVLAGELLREAEKLIASKIHPMTIIAGFRAAATVAESSLSSGARDHSKESPAAFRESLLRVARTTLSSKILTNDRDHFAELAVDAVLRLQRPEDGVSPPALDAINILKKTGGSLRDSFLDEGFILDKAIGVGQPRRVENAKILVANTAMDTDKIKIYGARVRVDSMAKVAELEAAERAKMREKVERIVSHGINAFVNRQLIYNFPEELFADAGVLAVEHADFDGIERLAAATGGEIASTFDGEPGSVRLGHCDVIEEVMVGDDRVVHFKGCAREDACTIVLRGSSSHVLDEAERSLHDALCVLAAAVADPRVVYGGGWPELRMARAVAEAAVATPGKKALAMESFAAALRGIPSTICDNAGLDAAEVVTRLRAAHAADPEGCTMGVDVRGSVSGGGVAGGVKDGNESSSAPIASDGGAPMAIGNGAGVGVGCMKRAGVTEAYRVKRQVLLSATEAAEMILRVDDIVKAAPRPRERE